MVLCPELGEGYLVMLGDVGAVVAALWVMLALKRLVPILLYPGWLRWLKWL